MNALALGRDGVVYDYFDGTKDLENKKLRTVGEAEERFREDALRLFRACRFIGQLDFMADKSLVRGMACLLYTSPSPRDGLLSRMPSSA